jgi:hypothetical protein
MPQSSSQAWSYLRRHPSSSYLYRAWCDMIQQLQPDIVADELNNSDSSTLRQRNSILTDTTWLALYALATDKTISSAVVLRSRVVACLQRYEQMIYGEALTQQPIIDYTDGGDMVSYCDKYAESMPTEQAKVYIDRLTNKLFEV